MAATSRSLEGTRMRVGFGYDTHRWVEGRTLYLGGIEIAHPFGLEGHSDADVLLHAICDALLGAIGDGDIGRHFPDTDPRYRAIRSTVLLGVVAKRLRDKGYRISNIDSTVVAEKPRLAGMTSRMVEEIARILEIDRDRVNVKATTAEGMGFIGREEGIAAYAVALVEEE